MIICSYCGTKNMVGIYFCEECGNPFLTEIVSGVPSEMRDTIDVEPLSATQKFSTRTFKGAPNIKPKSIGTTMLRADATLILHLVEKDERILIEGGEQEFILGRTPQHADLDLTPYSAAENGVSRRHAMIRRGEHNVSLIDLESANGTYLNGQKLLPQQPHILRDGDELTFGKLIARIYFT